MVLKFLLLFTLLSSNLAFSKASIRKLKVFRSKVVQVIKRSPYFKQEMRYKNYLGYVKKIKRKQKIKQSTLKAFLNLARIDTFLYAKTRSRGYFEQAMKSAYLAYTFNYSKREARTISSKLKKIKRYLGAKKPSKKIAKKKIAKRKSSKKRRKKIKLFKKKAFYSQIISWQEDRLGTDSAGNSFLLLAQLKGLCTGLSYDFVFEDIHFRTNGCFIFPGTVDIASDSPGAYDETEISTLGFVGGLGMIYQVYPKQLNFGFNLDVLARMNKFESATLDVDGETMITLGAAGVAEMIRDEKYGLEFKVGYGLAFTSLYWQIGLRYYY